MAEDIGAIDLINVHLKSKRAIVGAQDKDTDEVSLWLDELHGVALSQQLRQQEALSLHRTIIENKAKSKHPIILLGDFNNVLSASEFDPFHSRHRQRRKESRYFISPYHFYDTWKLVRHGEPVRPQDHIKTPITHYYGEKGNRIDHILVSSEFAPEYEYSLYEITEYTVTDKHIVDPIFGIDDVASDHALVSITFESRR
jgi:endonuclease/exonuclease/phosphatase family metal-dependent hydrolase